MRYAIAKNTEKAMLSLPRFAWALRLIEYPASGSVEGVELHLVITVLP